jgi:hypothetical protein
LRLEAAEAAVGILHQQGQGLVIGPPAGLEPVLDRLGGNAAAIDRLAAGGDPGDHPEAGGDPRGPVVQRPRQRPVEHAGIEFVRLAVGVDVGAGKAGGQERHAERRSGGKQLVNEGVFRPAERGERNRRLLEEGSRIDRAAVRRGDDHRDRLVRRQAAIQGLMIGQDREKIHSIVIAGATVHVTRRALANPLAAM